MAHNVSHISAFVPAKLREALEHRASRSDRSLSAEIRQALRAYTLSEPSGAAGAAPAPPSASEDKEGS